MTADLVVLAESLARKFHESYERLAPGFGYETRTDTREFDSESQNGRLMIAVCAELQGELRALGGGGRHPDSIRLDWLEGMARTSGLVLHLNDYDRALRTAPGIGLMPGRLDRDLRQAIDAANRASRSSPAATVEG